MCHDIQFFTKNYRGRRGGDLGFTKRIMSGVWRCRRESDEVGEGKVLKNLGGFQSLPPPLNFIKEGGHASGSEKENKVECYKSI